MGNPLQPSASNPTHGDLQESGHLLSRRVWLVPVTWLKAESPPHIHTDASTQKSVRFSHFSPKTLINRRAEYAGLCLDPKFKDLTFVLFDNTFCSFSLRRMENFRAWWGQCGSAFLWETRGRGGKKMKIFSPVLFTLFHNSPSLCFIQIHTLRIGPTCVSLIFPLLLLKGIQKVLFFWTLKEDAVQPVFRDCIENVLNTLQYNGQFQNLSWWLPWTHTHHVRFVYIVHFVGSLTWFWFFFLDNCSDGSLSVSVE